MTNIKLYKALVNKEGYSHYLKVDDFWIGIKPPRTIPCEFVSLGNDSPVIGEQVDGQGNPITIEKEQKL